MSKSFYQHLEEVVFPSLPRPFFKHIGTLITEPLHGILIAKMGGTRNAGGIMALSVLSQTLKTFFPYLQKVFILALLWTLPFALFEQFVIQIATDGGDRILWGTLGLALSFVGFILIQLVMGYGVLKLKGSMGLGDYFKKHLKHLLIETLRAFSKIAVGILLLVIPGIYRFIRLSLIRYIVLFEPDYEKGEIEALEHSYKLTQKDLFGYSLTLLLTHSAILAIQFYGMKFTLVSDPSSWALFFAFNTLISCFLFLYFYNYFLKLKLKLKQ